MTFKAKSVEHAQTWLRLYSENTLDQRYLLNNLARNYQGCLILLSTQVHLLPELDKVEYLLTLVNAQRDEMVSYLENELLNSSPIIHLATNKLEDILK